MAPSKQLRRGGLVSDVWTQPVRGLKDDKDSSGLTGRDGETTGSGSTIQNIKPVTFRDERSVSPRPVTRWSRTTPHRSSSRKVGRHRLPASLHARFQRRHRLQQHALRLHLAPGQTSSEPKTFSTGKRPTT